MKNAWNKKKTPVVRQETRIDGYFDAFVKNGVQQYTSYDSYYETKASDIDLTLMYQNALARKIVNAPAEDVVKNGFRIDGDEENKVYQELETLDFEKKLVDALRWDRLFGRSCILMLIDDGGKLSDPVNEKAIRRIHGLEVFDKRDISENYAAEYLNQDPLDKNFGKVEWYLITPPNGNRLYVHHSRLLLFDGEELPKRERIANNGAGLSCLDGVIKAIRRIETAHARAMDGVERSSTSLLKLNGLMDMVQSEQGTSIVRQRLDLIDLARQMLHTIAIDKDDEYQIYNMSLGGIAPLISEFEQIVCGMTTIPMTILFGRSPGGMNATGYADFENYNNMVKRIQKTKVKPLLERLVKLVMLSKEGPFKGEELENWSVVFNDLQQTTDLEKEQTEQAKINRQTAQLNLVNMLVERQYLDPTDAKQFLIEQQEFPVTEGEIDMDDYNDEENEDNIKAYKKAKSIPASQKLPVPDEVKQNNGEQEDIAEEIHKESEEKTDSIRNDKEPSVLTFEQVNAIRKYTCDHKNTTVADHILIEKAIKSAPLNIVQEDVVRIERGVAITQEDIDDIVQVGKYKPKRLTSWSMGKDVAKDYADDNVEWNEDKDFIPVILEYTGKDMLSHAIDVTKYSIKPYDKEVIFSSDITMYVVNCEQVYDKVLDCVDHVRITLDDKNTERQDDGSVFFKGNLESKKTPKEMKDIVEEETNEETHTDGGVGSGKDTM